VAVADRVLEKLDRIASSHVLGDFGQSRKQVLIKHSELGSAERAKMNEPLRRHDYPLVSWVSERGDLVGSYRKELQTEEIAKLRIVDRYNGHSCVFRTSKKFAKRTTASLDGHVYHSTSVKYR
jgi:hypothetical protein